MFSTYFGGRGVDAFEGIVAHPEGGLVVTGLTGSSGIPIVGVLGFECAGGRGDIPVVKINLKTQ